MVAKLPKDFIRDLNNGADEILKTMGLPFTAGNSVDEVMDKILDATSDRINKLGMELDETTEMLEFEKEQQK